MSRLTYSLKLIFLLAMLALAVVGCSDESEEILTPEERQWLEDHKGQVTIVSDPAYAPIEFQDKDGKFKGLAIDYLRLLEKRLDFKFKRVYMKSWDEITSAAMAHKVDIMNAAIKTPVRERYLLFTKPFIKIPMIIVVRKSVPGKLTLQTLAGKRVAVMKGAGINEYIEKNSTGLNIVPVENDRIGMRSLSFGEVDAMIIDLASASYYIDSQQLTNLRVAGNVKYSYSFCLASRNDWPVLNRILDKGLAAIPQEQHRAVKRKWISLSFTPIFRRKRFWRYASVVIIFILVLAGVIIVWNRTLARKVERKTIQLKQELAERQKAEHNIVHLQSLLSNIVNSMPSILISVDLAGRINQWNVEAEKATSLSMDEAKGRFLTEVFPTLKKHNEMIRKAINRLKPQKASKVELQLADEKRLVDITAYPLIDTEISGAVIRIDDIGERVRIEEMMIQSEKILSVGGLAAGMAHEINNPLAGIMQSTQVIMNRLSEQLPKNRRIAEECGTTIDSITEYMNRRGILPMLDSVVESGKRASKTVENMLSFSRKSEAQFFPQDVAQLLDKTVEIASNDYNLKKKYDFRRIKIVREYDPDTPAVQCEASKLQQVFLNLLKNGAHAMSDHPDPNVEPCLTLRVKPVEDMVQIEIQDNGPGMEETVRKRVFEPFFTTRGGGTGLGLSVSYFIITENHGGSMDVESKLGKGTRFIIKLPGTRRKS